MVKSAVSKSQQSDSVSLCFQIAKKPTAMVGFCMVRDTERVSD